MKKITILALVLVLCLAAIGIGYAKWTDEINLTGTVTTGSVDLEIVGYSGTWIYKNLTTHGMEVYTEPQEDENLLYIASAQAQAGQTDDSAVMTWDNLFPTCEEASFMADVEFHYVGTIPGVIDEIQFQLDPGSEWLLDPEMAIVEVSASIYDSEDPDRIGMVVDEGTQLHYCDYIRLVVTITIIQMNDNMLLEASGSAVITVSQWAECPEVVVQT